MKITNIETYSLIPNEYIKQQVVVIQIHTDEGIVGYGLTREPPVLITDGKPSLDHLEIRPIVHKVLKPIILSEDPFNIEKIWERMYTSRYKMVGGSLVLAISGVDIALHDIIGKALGIPVYKLLGGCYRREIPVYASFMHGRGERPEKIAQEAAAFVQDGFTSLKVRLAPRTDTIPGDRFMDAPWPIEKQIETVKAVRDAVGNDVEILVDANGGFTVSQAIRMAHRIERYEIGHFEEPVPSWDMTGLGEVRRAINIPVASGENLYTRYQFKELINRRVVDIVQPDIILAGGLSECKKIAVLADVQGMLIRPHNGWAHIGLAATMHFAASTPNCRGPQEYNIEEIPLREEGGLLKEPLKAHNGVVEVPHKPGLGITVDTAILEKYGIR